MNDPEAVIIPIGLFWIIFMIVKNTLDYKIRKQLIEKGLVNKNVKFLQNIESGFLSSLKWGLVLLGVGGALLISQSVNYKIRDEVMFGSMFLAAGLGLIIFYIIALFQAKKNPPHNGNSNGNDNNQENFPKAP